MAVADVNIHGYCSAGRKKLTVNVPVETAAGETDVPMNCLIKQIQFTVPALTGSHTAELKLQDEDNNTLYASTEKAESTTHVLTVERALCGLVTFRVETSGAEDPTVNCTVTVYYIT